VATIHVCAEGTVDAPADTVYGYLADLREHHPRFLPPAFSDFEVESGGIGAGTIARFKVTAGGRVREYRMTVAEPEAGVLTETDANSSLVTTFTVTPEAGASRVRISTSWVGAGGVGGFFERLFAPRVMRSIYADELERLNVYARERAAADS
jgi:Polyketide cyclase / dehydrase and lipid transport